MRELLELHSGQVAFISGLMSGFSLSVAAHVLRYGLRSRIAQLVFTLFLIASLLFLVALYVDVRLSIELVGYEKLSAEAEAQTTLIRHLGTSCATTALFIFIAATGLLGWLATPLTGVLSTLIGTVALATVWFIWQQVNLLTVLLQAG